MQRTALIYPDKYDSKINSKRWQQWKVTHCCPECESNKLHWNRLSLMNTNDRSLGKQEKFFFRAKCWSCHCTFQTQKVEEYVNVKLEIQARQAEQRRYQNAATARAYAKRVYKAKKEKQTPSTEQ
jgi:hypothetical protein